MCQNIWFANTGRNLNLQGERAKDKEERLPHLGKPNYTMDNEMLVGRKLKNKGIFGVENCVSICM